MGKYWSTKEWNHCCEHRSGTWHYFWSLASVKGAGSQQPDCDWRIIRGHCYVAGWQNAIWNCLARERSLAITVQKKTVMLYSLACLVSACESRAEIGLGLALKCLCASRQCSFFAARWLVIASEHPFRCPCGYCSILCFDPCPLLSMRLLGFASLSRLKDQGLSLSVIRSHQEPGWGLEGQMKCLPKC